MADFKSIVVARILDVLPEAKEEASEAVDHLVDNLGLRHVEDLALIAEEDVSNFLGVFRTRRLLHTWKEKSRETPALQPAREQSLASNDQYDFQIDWDDLYKGHDCIKDRLTKGKKLRQTHKREFVKRIVNQVRGRVPHAKRDIFKQIMRAMKRKFPVSFKSELAKGKLDKTSLCSRMQTKFDNDRRPPRRTRMEQQAPAIKAAYGCKNWRVTSLPGGETEESLQQVQEELASYFETTRHSAWNWDYIDDAMEKTYRSQRADINKQAEQLIELEKVSKKKKRRKNQKTTEQNQETAEQNEENEDEPEPEVILLTTEQIRDKWPFLFQPRGMIAHFNKLTDTNMATAFLAFITNSLPNILKFLIETNDKNGTPSPKRIKKKVKQSKETLPCYNAEMIGLLILLMQRFKEKSESMWIIVDPSAMEEDIPRLCTIPATPRLIIAGEDVFNPTTVFYSMDKQILGTADNFLEGIGLLFAAYFVFNLEFDAEAQVTLEFIQRCIVEINPTNGHKRPKEGEGNFSKYKVHKFLTKFNTKFDEYMAEQEQDSSEETN